MTDDFFKLGGSSLELLRLIGAIECEFGTRIPVALLLKKPTPKHATTLLAPAKNYTHGIPSLVPLQNYTPNSDEVTGTTEATPEFHDDSPLFCIHAAGGHAMFYREFAKKLGPHQAIYALQPKGIDGFEKPILSIEEMATHYIDEILNVYPVGPHHFMSYCYGGGLILEMVRQLESRGIQIGKIIVVDALAPIPKSHPMSRFGWYAYLLFEQLYFKNYSYLWHRAKAIFVNQIQHPSSRLSIRHLNNNDQVQPPSHLLKVQNACEYAFRKYRALPTSRTVHIIRGQEPGTTCPIAYYMRAWPLLAPNHKSYQLAIHHTRLFTEPELTQTSECIKQILHVGSQINDLQNNVNDAPSAREQ